MIDAKVVRHSLGRTELSACRRLCKAAAKVPADQVIVELGSFCGRTTAWLALGAQRGGARVFAVDPWDLRDPSDIPDQPAHIERAYTNGSYRAAFPDFIEHLRSAQVENVTAIRGFSADVGRTWSGPPVGLLFHDARHTAEAVAEDVKVWAPHMAPGSLMAFHDAANPNLGVIEGAQALEHHPEWDWEGRKLYRWAKHPARRGMLVVKHA